VIDSGISLSNCDYGVDCGPQTRYAAQISFVTNLNGSTTAPNDGQDYFGHGTHVASILAGYGTFSTSFVNQWNIYPWYWVHGVATGVHVISERVLDSTGAGTDSSVIAAIDWAISNKSQYNIRVINLSLGRPFTTSYKLDPLCQAAEKAWHAGIVVVVAAGNYGRSSPATEGYGTITAPGNDPLVITVGAVNTRGTTDRTQHVVASYSSKGPTGIDHIVKPDLVAPGNNIYATQCYMPPATGSNVPCPLVTSYPANKVMNSDFATLDTTNGDSWYFRLSGTSMATPMVSGAAAILLQKNPSLTPDQVKAILMATATKSNFVPSYYRSHVPGDSRPVDYRRGRTEHYGGTRQLFRACGRSVRSVTRGYV
jgi:serine protease AprX